MDAPPTPAAELLDRARATITHDRQATYGKPEDNLGATAALWNDYLARRRQVMLEKEGAFQLSAIDVAHMMILLKVARLAESPDHVDSKLDIAGYAGCAHQCAEAAKLRGVIHDVAVGAQSLTVPWDQIGKSAPLPCPATLRPIGSREDWIQAQNLIFDRFDPHHDTLIPDTIRKIAERLGIFITNHEAELMIANELQRKTTKGITPRG